MTAKEMASWERWHRRGRKSFQGRIALIWFLVQGVAGCLLSHALDLKTPPTYWLGTSLILTITSYISMGHLWDSREAEYRQQIQTATDSSNNG
ncbi:MAG: hypothetical protein ACOZE5_19040 [Verrucomicrobiota bacterium]